MSSLVVICLCIITLGKLGCASPDFGDVDIISLLTVYAVGGNVLQEIAVCHDGFNMAAANVVCRQLGYVSADTFRYAKPDTLTQYVYTRVQCPTVSNYQLYGESHIMRCNLTGPVLANTVYCEATSLECSTERLYDSPYEGQVYLDKTGSVSPSDGSLEIYLDGRWEKVCHTDDFNDAVATSVCRQYGYTGYNDKQSVIEVGRSSLDFSSYSCKDDSFACFSHCISKPYHQSTTCEHVFLNCGFAIENITFRTSGSQGICATNQNHCSTMGIGVALGVFIFTTLLSVLANLVIVCICYYTCMRRKKATTQSASSDSRNMVTPTESDPLTSSKSSSYTEAND